MLHLLIWSLACVGCTLVLTRSALFERWRGEEPRAGWRKFLACPMCVGFWVGISASVFYSPARALFPTSHPWLLELIARDLVAAFANACAASLMSSVSVRTWEILGELHACLSLWRHLHAPRSES